MNLYKKIFVPLLVGMVTFMATSCVTNTSSIGSFRLVGNMKASTSSHSATLLKDGRVFICGKNETNPNKSFSFSELYDPVTKKFQDLKLDGCGSNDAVILPNGKVFLLGGIAELYDPSINKLNAIDNLLSVLHEVPPPYPLAKKGSSYGIKSHIPLVKLADGNVLLSGGDAIFLKWGKGMSKGKKVESGDYLEKAFIYNYLTNSFSQVASMHYKRENHQATLLRNGSVLITGGLTFSSINHNDNSLIQIPRTYTSNTAEIFDPNRKQFILLSNCLVKARQEHQAILLNDGRVLLTGGISSHDNYKVTNTAEVYNPTNQSFEKVGNMIYPRHYHKMTLLSDGTVLITGGCEKGFSAMDTAEIFNPRTNMFKTLPRMNTARALHTSTLLLDNTVLLTGGIGSYTDQFQNSVEVFIKNHYQYN